MPELTRLLSFDVESTVGHVICLQKMPKNSKIKRPFVNLIPHPALHYSWYSARRLLKITQFEQQHLSSQSNSAPGFDSSFFWGGVL
jgi:hypothetical protein